MRTTTALMCLAITSVIFFPTLNACSDAPDDLSARLPKHEDPAPADPDNPSSFDRCLGNSVTYAASSLASAMQPGNRIFAAQSVSRPHVPGEILIRFAEGLTRQQASALILDHGATLTQDQLDPEMPWNRWLKATLPGSISVESALRTFDALDEVIQVQPNYIYGTSSTVPNDWRFPQLWGLENTGQTIRDPDGPIKALSGIDTQITALWDNQTDCSSVLVAMLDTGVDYRHWDLAQNLWDGAGCPKGNCPNHGWDFVNEDNDPMDDSGHGTHVAGIVGALANNIVGVSGVCWNAALMMVKVMDASGDGTSEDIAQGMDFAREAGARIVNMSLGGDGEDALLFDAAEKLQASGAIVVTAAGNGGKFGGPIDTDEVFFHPGCFDLDNIINVAAMDPEGRLADFSNYGAVSVDLGAPGVSILSTYIGLGHNRYKYMDGTSMATAYVSGISALLWARYPEATSRQMILSIFEGTESLGSLGGKTCTGGMVNAKNAFDRLAARLE